VRHFWDWMTGGRNETRVGAAGPRLSQSNCAGKDLGHWRWWEKETQEEGTASFIKRTRQPRWGRRVRRRSLTRILIPDSLLIVLPVVPNAVFLSVYPSLIAVGFGSSVQLLGRGFSFRHDGGEDGRWKREKEGGGRRSGKARIADQTTGVTERASTPSSICLSDPQRRDEAGCAGGSPK